MEALQIARLRRPDTPFIFVSGTIGEERAIRALKQGAVDYVLKEGRARLVPAIERALREAEDRDARRWAQRELEESEERFRFAMHFSSVGMALVAPDGRWLSVNPALCAIVGYGERELLATDVQSLTYPDDRDADAVQVRQMLDRVIETYQTNKRFVRKDGRVVWTQLSGSLVWLQAGEAALLHLSDPRHHRPHRCGAGAARERGEISLDCRGHAGVDLGNRRGRRLYLLQSGGGGDPRGCAGSADRQELPRHAAAGHPA